jgi:hypothetical protein
MVVVDVGRAGSRDTATRRAGRPRCAFVGIDAGPALSLGPPGRFHSARGRVLCHAPLRSRPAPIALGRVHGGATRSSSSTRAASRGRCVAGGGFPRPDRCGGRRCAIATFVAVRRGTRRRRSTPPGAVATCAIPPPAPRALGRRRVAWFHAAGDDRLLQDGRACASCHPDGRETRSRGSRQRAPGRRSCSRVGPRHRAVQLDWPERHHREASGLDHGPTRWSRADHAGRPG